MKERMALIVSTIDELIEKLSQYCNKETEIEGLYKGNVKKNNTHTELLIEEEEGGEFIRSIINKKKVYKLAQLWVSGVEIDWHLLYTEGKPEKISLPTYPFAKNSYWIRESSVATDIIMEKEEVAVFRGGWFDREGDEIKDEPSINEEASLSVTFDDVPVPRTIYTRAQASNRRAL